MPNTGMCVVINELEDCNQVSRIFQILALPILKTYKLVKILATLVEGCSFQGVKVRMDSFL